MTSRAASPAVPAVRLADFVAGIGASVLAPWIEVAPWEITAQSAAIVRRLLARLPAGQYASAGEVWVHRSAVVEPGAVLKGPLIVGPDCHVAAGAYLRGGSWLDAGCIVGPGAELKSSFVFAGSRLAHFNFVGDAIVGCDVNCEAGSLVCNRRNERSANDIKVRVDGVLRGIGQEKFGAVIGDHVRLGANAVVAPGALLRPGTVVPRASLHDEELSS